MLRNIRYLDTI